MDVNLLYVKRATLEDMHLHQLRKGWIMALLFVSLQATGQWREYFFTYMGPGDGLQTKVNEFAQDPGGYMYLATDQGLIRYDGNSFEVFAHDPGDSTSIGPGEVDDLCFASDGFLWLGTRVSGLHRFDPETLTFRHYPLPPLPQTGIPGVAVIEEDDQKNLWIGGSHFQLYRLDRTNEKLETYVPSWLDPFQHGGRLTIKAILQDHSDPDLLWLSVLDYKDPEVKVGEYGIVTFHKREKTFRSHPASGNICWQDGEGVLWGTHWGNFISSYQPSGNHRTFHFRRLSGPDGHCIDLLPFEDYFLISGSRGLWRFHHSRGYEFVDGSEEFGALTDLYMDHSGNTWIGSHKGAYVLNPRDQNIGFLSLQQFDLSDRIYPGRLANDPENEEIFLVASTVDPVQRQRIYRIPGNQRTRIDFVETGFDVHGVAIDREGTLWIAGNGRLHNLARDKQVPTIAHIPGLDTIPWLWNLQSNSSGWIGGAGHDEAIFFHPSRNSGFTIHRSELADTTGRGWLAKSFEGLSFTPEGNAFLFSSQIFFVELETREVVPVGYDCMLNPHDEDLRQVVQDEMGRVWLSSSVWTAVTELKGDSLIIQKTFSVREGLSPAVHELHIDKQNRVWAFTGNGINCIEPKSGEVRYFGVDEGLPEVYIDPRQVLTLSNGALTTVNANGLILFHPDSLWSSRSPEEVVTLFKRLRIDNEITTIPSAGGNIIELQPAQRNIDIEFQGLSFPNADHLEYSYRIQGLQEQWISINNNKLVTLPALNPGTYQFEVKAGSPGSAAPVSALTIFVKPPFYTRTWFLALSLAVLISALWFLYSMRIRQIKRREKSHTEFNKRLADLELKGLRAQMNPHFMFNSLNSIKNYILSSDPIKAAEYLSSFAHLIRMILQHSREKYITLQAELDAMQLYIELEKLRLDSNFDFHCRIGEGVWPERILIPPLLLQPFVENAIWHGLMPKKGSRNLWLTFKQSESDLLCIIEDDGIGRKAAETRKSTRTIKHKSLGLGIIRDRIEIYNRTENPHIRVDILDKEDEKKNPTGTRVEVRIPQSIFQTIQYQEQST